MVEKLRLSVIELSTQRPPEGESEETTETGTLRVTAIGENPCPQTHTKTESPSSKSPEVQSHKGRRPKSKDLEQL